VMVSSSPCWPKPEPLRASLAALALLLLSACGGIEVPRAVIEDVRLLQRGPALQLEVQQRLDFEPNMLDALSNGIGLRLDYRVDYCRPAQRTLRSLWLRYYPLANEFEMRWEGEPHGRRFARRGALLAALDQVRIELPDAAAGCELALRVQLERSALPAPLRFPALIGLQDWRLASAPYRMSPRAAP
jgi:hypothetical protein